MELVLPLAAVNTLVYGAEMADQLSAKDWLDQGLKTLAKGGFTALKADPLAKAMGVSRGSFYWHFADVGAFHAELLKYWREVAAEQIIADVEAASDDGEALQRLLRRVFRTKPPIEAAIRSWATHDPAVRKAVQAIDARRLSYVIGLLEKSGLTADAARARAHIFYWAFVGFALSDKPLTPEQQDAVIEQLVGLATRHV